MENSMIDMRPLVYQFRNGSSPYIIISGILCLSMILWMSWLGDLLANFLSAGSGQNGNGQGEQEKKKGEKKGKKKPLPPTNTGNKGGSNSGIEREK